MIYLAMAVSLALLIWATLATYRDYMQGKVGRTVFTRLRMILILLIFMFIIVLIGRWTGVTR